MPLPGASQRYMRLQLVGDPFLGGLLRGIGSLGKKLLPLVPGPVGAAAGLLLAPKPPPPPTPSGVGAKLPGGFALPGIPSLPNGLSLPIPLPPSVGPLDVQMRQAAGFIAPSISLKRALELGYQVFKMGTGFVATHPTVGVPAVKIRRQRRMNPLNPRALRRSIRRVRSFARFAQRSIAIAKRVRVKRGRKR